MGLVNHCGTYEQLFLVVSSTESPKTLFFAGRKTQLIPAAVELNGRWGDGMVSLFKKAVALATREGCNEGGFLRLCGRDD